MNPFDRARLKAVEIRKTLAGAFLSDQLTSKQLLDTTTIEDELDLVIALLPPDHFNLAGADGVLAREKYTVYVRNDKSWPETAYLIAHEIGHWFLDADKPAITVAHLSAMTASQGNPALLTVEAYGARERQELQANVFARELLLPRQAARALWVSGMNAKAMSTFLKVPLEVVRLQLFDALLLPDLPITPMSALPPMTQVQANAAHASERFVNVVAGPGTGKTTTLVHRIKHLIEQGVTPSKILVLTFTNKAAHELVERMRASAIPGASDVWAGTFHAFGLEFLRKYHDLFQLKADVGMADRLTKVRQMVRLLPTISLQYYVRLQDPYEWLPKVLDYVDRLKEELVSVTDYRARLAALPAPTPDVAQQQADIAVVYEAYEAELRAKQLVDYTDLVALPTLQARKDRASVSQYIDHFDHILVDEYQDVTHVMVEFIRELAVNAKSVWVVGDVRQAIHHWRGASIQSLMKFDSAFRRNAPHASVATYNLDINRRSTPEILKLFSHTGRDHKLQIRLPLQPVNAHRASIDANPILFECTSIDSQAQTLANVIGKLSTMGVNYRDQVIISRSTANIERTAEDLSARGIPYLYIGDVHQRTEIKRLICLMQLLCTRQPRSLVGLLHEPNLALSIADMKLLMDSTSPGTGVGLQRGKWIGTQGLGLSVAGEIARVELAKLLAGFDRHTNPWDFVCTLLLDRRFGLPNPADTSMNAHTERLALWLFVYAVRNNDGNTKEARLSPFLLREDLRRRINEKLADRGVPPEARALNAITLMTVHGSKGLEFNAVHVTDVDKAAYGAEQAWDYDPRSTLLIPPEVLNSTQAEHNFKEAVERNNLLYVALSRARDRLFLYETNPKDRPSSLSRAGSLLERYSGAVPLPPVVPPAPVAASTAPLVVNYGAFESYISCPLHYHYRYELDLTAEQDIDVSIRARWAVMEALQATLKGATAQTAFETAWASHDLPAYTLDKALYSDAVKACSKGLQIIKDTGGVIIEGLHADIAGVRIELPWMLQAKGSRGTELHWLRTHAGVDTTSRHLRPLMLAMTAMKVNLGTVHSLISEKSKAEPPSKDPRATAVHKMAHQFAAGYRGAKKGWLCRRCPYLSICENRP
ncbi:UvrD-helicase domain-containing protein [Pseudomonas syringae]|uniref:UvrD-helicase domain-containing protein n=1 Tax=Pseudomonas syringae TaxID=317 RepID=UPI0002097F5E|nr:MULTISPECIES: UvrD-helicase domain-containing protein [Pseudomonas syringae group]EGH96677.1 UvrD/REP helicase family protein [Pseudomonas amygdali pv. lachrymans str. M302278]RMM13751.1 UvrD/REP helicase protein [Pseudomonas syringae]